MAYCHRIGQHGTTASQEKGRKRASYIAQGSPKSALHSPTLNSSFEARGTAYFYNE